MAEHDDKTRAPDVPAVPPGEPPAAEPFASDVAEWETELAAWDLAIPISTPPAATTPMTAGDSAFSDAPTTDVSETNPMAVTEPPSGRFTGPFGDDLTPSSGSYVAIAATAEEPPPVLERDPVIGSSAGEPLANSQFAIPTGMFDDGSASQSGSYAALVAEAPLPRILTIFDTPPPDDPPVNYPGSTLPEMGTELWQGEAAHTLTIGSAAAATAPDVETWRELGQMVEDELGQAQTPDRRADLALAAARLAETLGDLSGARGYVERALANDRLTGGPYAAPDGWTAAHRARLCLAERAGTVGDDPGAAESLARLALLPHPDQGAYRALQAEWAVARTGHGNASGSAAALVAGLPEGLPRTLAEAEVAWKDAPAAAAILAHAGQVRGGVLGASLLVIAAARNEVSGDFQAAADQRAAAAAQDPRRTFVRAGLLRDVARLSPAEAFVALRELLPVFAPSPLRVALALWAAKLGASTGHHDEALSLIAAPALLGPVTPALVRDRLAVRQGTGAPIALSEARALLDGLQEQFDSVAGRVVAARLACAWASDDEAREDALARVEVLRDAGTGVVALAPAVEALAAGATGNELGRRALRVWREIDPARWTAASYALAAASDEQTAEAIAAEIAAREPGAPLFLRRAAWAARSGQFAAAAALLDAGAAAWSHTRLAGPLRELAAERLARVDVGAACDRLEMLLASDASPAVRLTRARALRALRDRERWLMHVRAAGPEISAARRAALLIEGHFWGDAPAPGDAALDQAFELVPLHPVALGLLLGGQPGPAVLADRWVAAAQVSRDPRTALEAAMLLSLSGETRRALELLLARLPVDGAAPPAQSPVDVATRDAVQRLAWAEGDAAGRAAVLRRTGRPDEPIPESARLQDDHAPGVGRGPVPAEIPAEHDETVAVSQLQRGPVDRLAALEHATLAGSWSAVVEHLIDAPPHAVTADPETLGLAVDVDAAHPGAARAAAILAAVGVEAAPEARPPGPALAFRTFTHAAALAPGGARALEAAAALATRLADGRSAALFLIEAAQGDAASAERLMREAVARDPASAPAAIAWRRWLARAGRSAEAAAAGGAEAEALVEPVLRVAALVRAAALARSDGPVPPGQEPLTTAARLAAAAVYLRRALELAPQDAEVFGRLRDLYDEAGDQAALADLLAARLTVTSNPFETTALHLARAELFAGPLADRARAKTALAAILAREPNHPRALGRMADLEEDEGNYAAAAELLVQRSGGERSPEKLRELFLRLGRIHVQHLPDAKRASAAYARVLQLDAKNREALDALSLLYVEMGDAKNANAMTERLLGVEDSAARRVVYHLRLGQVAERGGEQIAALEHFRRAADESPRDIHAITELARYLDKVHDLASRKLVLDTAAAQLRTAVLARPGFAGEREALATVQRLRGRPAAADAALEIGVFLAAAAGEVAPAVEARGTRRLTALASPTLEDRLFPATVPPSVRHLFRMLAPIERSAYRPEVNRWGAERGHRVGEGRPPRDVFDRVATELGAGAYELYVVPARGAPLPPLVALPGKPPALIVGASLLQGGTAAVTFAAARALRLTSSYLDLALAGGEGELAAWLTGVIRQFVPTYQRSDVAPDAAAAATARMARQIPKKARPELLPFALESSGELNVAALMAGIREGADRVGLLASGSLAAALAAVFAVTGERVSADALRDFPEALALLEFALSDEHDDLLQLLV